jgi:hypothetical protein
MSKSVMSDSHCYDSERGHQLQRQAAQRTMAARPQPIVEVPYLLINDYSPRTTVNSVSRLPPSLKQANP